MSVATATAATSSIRLISTRFISGGGRHGAVAAAAAAAAAGGGMCLLALQQQQQQHQPHQPHQPPYYADVMSPNAVRCEAASMPSTSASYSTSSTPRRPRSVPIQTGTQKDERGTASQATQGKASSSSSSSSICLDQLDIMNLKREEALQLIQHIFHHSKTNNKDQNMMMDVTHLMQICQATAELLKQEPTLVDKTGIETVSVVGDLHGSLGSLEKVLQILGRDLENSTDAAAKSRCIVFDGDFVDRGDDSIEVLLTLLLFKIAYPEQVVLIRGNHEDSMVAQVYGFADELLHKYNMGGINDNENNVVEAQKALQTAWIPISQFFSALPMGVVTDTAFIVHGGLPSKDFSLDQLRRVTVQDRCQYASLVEVDTPTELMLGGLLWSDPSSHHGIHPNRQRGRGVTFGPDVTREFLTQEHLRYLVRGHEEVPSGYQQRHCGNGKSVITVFSAVDYTAGEHNLGSIVNLTSSDGQHTPITFDLPHDDDVVVVDNTIHHTQHAVDECNDSSTDPTATTTTTTAISSNLQRRSSLWERLEGLAQPFMAFSRTTSQMDEKHQHHQPPQ